MSKFHHPPIIPVYRSDFLFLQNKVSEIHQTSDGGYILSGYTTSFGAGSLDAYMVKTDSAGNLQWSASSRYYNRQPGAHGCRCGAEYGGRWRRRWWCSFHPQNLLCTFWSGAGHAAGSELRRTQAIGVWQPHHPDTVESAGLHAALHRFRIRSATRAAA